MQPRVWWAITGAFLLSLSAHLSAKNAAQVDPSIAYDRNISAAKASMMSDARLALKKAAQAYYAAIQMVGPERTRAVVTTLWVRADALERLDDAKSAKPIIAAALAGAQRLDPSSTLVADMLLTSGAIDADRNDFGSALTSHQSAYEVFREKKVARGQAVALVNISQLYILARDYSRALRYLRDADAIKSVDARVKLAIKNSEALVHAEQGNDAVAIFVFREALPYAAKIQSPSAQTQILMNIARAELAEGDTARAHTVLKEATALSSGRHFLNDPMLVALESQVNLRLGRSSRAVSQMDRAFAGIDLSTTTQAYLEGHKAAVEVYSAAGNPAAAFAHLTAVKRLEDQATKLATDTSTALMAARFDYANQNLKIIRLQREELRRSVAFEQARVRTERWFFLAAAATTALVLAMLSFGLVTIRRSRNEVRDANNDLELSNAALKKALAAKTDFLATTSHEIRTPLNGILGMVQVGLADADSDRKSRDRLRLIGDAGETMKNLVDDILDVAKMETGNLTIEDAPFDLRATVQATAMLTQGQARGRGIGFILDLEQCPRWINGDQARIRQILFNLLSNAVKFTAEGSIGLKVEAHADGRYRIVVTDTGIGIAEDKHETIFEAFRQADTSTTRRFGGTGLGLSICRNLAGAMGGRVDVESAVGEGSTFTVELPLVAALAADEPAESVASSHALLIVDRSPIVRAMLATALSKHVGKVVHAANAGDAVRLIGAGGINHVVADVEAITEPGGDRVAAAIGIASASRVAGAEVTLLWPSGEEARAPDAAAAGVTRLLAKPVSGVAIAAAIFGSDNSYSERLVPKAA